MAKKRNPAEETDSDLLIDMQDIVKTFNIGTPNELTILHGVNFNLARANFFPWSVPRAPANQPS